MRILIIFTAFLLGCNTPEAETIIVSNNEQKDSYIAKVEEVVSDSVSALVAVVPSVTDGVPRQIVQGQIERLSGISKPSVDKVKQFEKIIKDNDTKAVQKDKVEAAKVDAETTKLWAEVERKDKQISEANARREQAEQTLREERKTKVLLQASLACLGLFLFGVLVVAFSPIVHLKKAGVIIVIIAVAAEASLLWYMS